MSEVEEFLARLPSWMIGLIVGLVLIGCIVAFVQGREISFRSLRIGPRPSPDALGGRKASKLPETDAGDASEHLFDTGATEISGHARRSDVDQWERHALVNHDRLFGVDSLINAVVDAIQSSTSGWVVSLFGDGGIGKTAVAYEATRRIAYHWGFSKIAWASAKGTSFATDDAMLRAAYWHDIICSISEQMGHTLGLSRALWEEEFGGHMRALPDDVRVLLVVDNLENVKDTKNVVERLHRLGFAKPHKLMVTTRWSIETHRSAVNKEFRMRNLDPPVAMELVRHLGRTDPDLRTASSRMLTPILRVTEGNPFLLKLVVSYYLETHRSLDHVMAELTDLGGAGHVADENIGLGRRVRDHLYAQSLEELATRFDKDLALRLMGAFCVKGKGDSMTYEELRSISEITDAHEFARILKTACRLSLVRSSDKNRRYSIHSLLHQFTCGADQSNRKGR